MSKLSKELKVSSSLSTELEGLLESARRYQILIAAFRASRGYVAKSLVTRDVSCSRVGIEFSSSIGHLCVNSILELVEWLLHPSSHIEVKRRSILVSVRSQGIDWSK